MNSILTLTIPSFLPNQYCRLPLQTNSPYDRKIKLSSNIIANLRPDEALAGRIREYQAKRKRHADDNLSVSGGVTSVEELGKFYHALDDVRDILNTTLEGWEAPQVIVIGGQSSGKSTVLVSTKKIDARKNAACFALLSTLFVNRLLCFQIHVVTRARAPFFLLTTYKFVFPEVALAATTILHGFELNRPWSG